MLRKRGEAQAAGASEEREDSEAAARALPRARLIASPAVLESAACAPRTLAPSLGAERGAFLSGLLRDPRSAIERLRLLPELSSQDDEVVEPIDVPTFGSAVVRAGRSSHSLASLTA